jgi:predicted transcriptional regulator/transcriptional regulator with XRE-family HTH domain
MPERLSGLRIRALRREKGLTQNELARQAGISASYLNLIESSKRTVAGSLLQRIAAVLQVDAARLDGSAERRLVELLEELASQPAAGGTAPAGAEEIVGRHPAWAALILRLHRALHDQTQAVQALADRLNRDPFLGESVHRMLTHVTAISSAAEILREGEALGPGDRERFLSIIAADSVRMSTAAQALLEFFDSSQIRIRSATPMEHVDSFIFQTDNHFPELEAIVESFASPQPDRQAVLAAAQRLSDEAGPMPAETDMPPESVRFEIARRAASRLAGEAIAEIVRRHPALDDEEARSLAAKALASYAAGAMLMPYEPFLEAAERSRYDLDHLCRRFGVSYEQAAHRVATLHRAGAEGVRFAFMRSDPSGYVTKRLPLAGLPLPRYGTACPLWPVYGAFQTPGMTVRDFGELPSGERFLMFARAVDKAPAQVGRPRRLLSIMLACEAADAHRLAYADGIEQARATNQVGTVCRLCTRAGCGHRQEAPLIARTGAPDKMPMSAASRHV